MEGVDIPLDDCGGHSQSALGYYCHPNVIMNATKGYDAPMISPNGCWKGDISKIANFWIILRIGWLPSTGN